MAAFNGFDTPTPGQSLTSTPGQAAWEHPPKYTKVSDATNFIFNSLMNEPKLHQIMNFMKSGVPLEAIAKIIIFSGFSSGFWTPDLGLLLGKPVMYMLSAIAHRAGIKAKVTHIDRSGMKEMVGFHNMKMSISSPASMEPPQDLQLQLKGLMAPDGE